jgi:hypothetical protein
VSDTPTPGADPCQLRLERDLTSAGFEAAVAAGQWRVISLIWPTLIVSVSLGDDVQVGLRINLDDYPVEAPSGRPWDLDADAPLPASRWPMTGRSPEVFRAETDWPTGRDGAPYLACDRVALTTHTNWPTEHPERCWNPSCTIEFYLQELHRELAGARPRV